MSNAASRKAGPASEKATETIDAIEGSLDRAEEKIRQLGGDAGEVADELGAELKDKAADSLATMESFICEKPLQAAGLAFAAGVVATVIFRKRN